MVTLELSGTQSAIVHASPKVAAGSHATLGHGLHKLGKAELVKLPAAEGILNLRKVRQEE